MLSTTLLSGNAACALDLASVHDSDGLAAKGKRTAAVDTLLPFWGAAGMDERLIWEVQNPFTEL